MRAKMSILQHNETTVLSTDKSSRARERKRERERGKEREQESQGIKHDQGLNL